MAGYGEIRWRIADLLERRKLSTYRLIAISGIHPTQAYRLARREPFERIDVDLLAKLCAALDVQPGDLLEYVPHTRVPRPQTRSPSPRRR